MNKKVFLFNANDPNNLPTPSIPQYVEKESQSGWVIYGKDNLYPEYLKALMNKSSKHSAIIKGKSAMIGGNGWIDNDLSTAAYNFLGNPYNKEEDMNAILAKVAYDNEIYGGFALNIIWSKDRSRISSIKYVDPSKIRIAVPKFNTYGWDPVDQYFYCDDWRNTRKYKPVLLSGYSTEDRSEASQILYVKDYRPGTEWYAQPEYLSAVNWVELEWEISQFHLKSIKNGFHPSMMINFTQGIPTEEEQDYLVRQLRKEYQGSIEAGNVIFTFSEDKDGAPIITPIQLNTSDEKFIQLNNDVTEGIMVGHRVTNPVLFGVKTPGQLGGANEMVDAMRVFQAMYVDSKQNMIEKVFTKLARVNGVTDDLIIKKHKIELDVNIIPNDILNILSSNLSPNQKQQIFIAMGYSEETAQKLIQQ